MLGDPLAYMTAVGACPLPDPPIDGSRCDPSGVASIPAEAGVLAGPPVPVASTPSMDVLGVFGFLGFGHTSPLSRASAWRFSNSDLVGRPRFLRGGSMGLMVMGASAVMLCDPFTVENAGGRGWISRIPVGAAAMSVGNGRLICFLVGSAAGTASGTCCC